MKITVKPAKYIVAVSGGVDSVVLLDLLKECQGATLVVAHFDHGIRPDSADDAESVKRLSESCGLEFETKREELGVDASEELARKRRYLFLNDVREKHNASAIITAHHQDDVIETMMLNILRGSGRKGLSSLVSGDIVRPLLHFSKKQITEHAVSKKITWREDSTNTNTEYLRNYIRHEVVAKLTVSQRNDLVSINNRLQLINSEIDAIIKEIIDTGDNKLDRYIMNSLDFKIAAEIVAQWLRDNGVELSKRLVQDATIFCRVGRKNAKFSVSKDKMLLVTDECVKFTST